MAKETTCPITQESLLHNDRFWQDLYEHLQKPVTSFVHRCKIPSWAGQEDDMVQDIIQETVMRIYKKFLTTPNEAFSIQSMEAFSYTIAYRYCLDLLRKERRIARLSQAAYEFEMQSSLLDREDELTIMLEVMTVQTFLIDAARIIAAIPNKQRRAILVDLARYNDFTEKPTAMELAFLEVGIELRDYRNLLPLSHLERSRHNALVSLGYRRVRSDFQATFDNPGCLTGSVAC